MCLGLNFQCACSSVCLLCEPGPGVVKGGALLNACCLGCSVTLQLALVFCLSQGHSQKMDPSKTAALY